MEKEVRCPLCVELVHTQYALKGMENKVATWLHCRCGYMWHEEPLNPKEQFNVEYKTKYEALKKIEERQKYYVRMYAQILEEKTYGRRMLDVGFCSPIILREMERRGWLTAGVDIIPNDYVTGDFMDEKFEGEKFDLIWMSDFLQCTKNPIQAIYKAFRLLNPQGILFVVTPNTDLIRRDVIPAWGHWDMTTNYSFINQRILREAFMKCSKSFNSRMDILYSDWSNQSNRFSTWNNMHVIAQKTHIIDNPAFDKEMENVGTPMENKS